MTPVERTPNLTRQWPGFNGVTIAGDVRGPEDGQAIILLHGGGQTRHAWTAAAEGLADLGYCAITLDARGHGDSSWAEDGDYSEDAFVQDLVAVTQACGCLHPVLVGASLGGGTSLSAIGEGWLDAEALVLVDVTPQVEERGAAAVFDFMRTRPEGFETLEEVAEAIANYQPHRPRRADLNGLAKNVRRGSDGRFHWHWDPRFVERAPDLKARQVQQERCALALRVPTLLVRGALSNVVSEEGARRFLEICPRSEYVNVEEAAHMVAGDRNDVFLAVLVEFVARVAPPLRWKSAARE